MVDSKLCVRVFHSATPEGTRQMPCRSATCGAGMAYHHDLVLDSLPYYDSDLTTFPFLRDRALDEIARELGTVPTQLHPNVPPEVKVFEVRGVRDGWGEGC